MTRPRTQARCRTREERRRREDAIIYIGDVLLVVAFLFLLVMLHRCAGPEPETPSAQERAARYYASQEYERVLNMGMSEWSAQQAAELLYGPRRRCFGGHPRPVHPAHWASSRHP